MGARQCDCVLALDRRMLAPCPARLQDTSARIKRARCAMDNGRGGGGGGNLQVANRVALGNLCGSCNLPASYLVFLVRRSRVRAAQTADSGNTNWPGLPGDRAHPLDASSCALGSVSLDRRIPNGFSALAMVALGRGTFCPPARSLARPPASQPASKGVLRQRRPARRTVCESRVYWLRWRRTTSAQELSPSPRAVAAVAAHCVFLAPMALKREVREVA